MATVTALLRNELDDMDSNDNGVSNLYPHHPQSKDLVKDAAMQEAPEAPSQVLIAESQSHEINRDNEEAEDPFLE